MGCGPSTGSAVRGPALVLLHGLGSSHLMWSAVEAAFAERFTVYALDVPGFGYSDKPPATPPRDRRRRSSMTFWRALVSSARRSSAIRWVAPCRGVPRQSRQ